MGTEMETRQQTEEALAARATSDLVSSGDEFVIPRLKVAQSLTAEVVEEEAEVGELIHSLTGESYGENVSLIIVDSFKGRSWRDPETRMFYTANRETIVPWEEHPCFGEHFADCPDAEEVYRAAVRANEKDWGRGPGISTTYNFVGLIVGEEGVDTFPVRLTLQRSSAKEGRNLATLLTIARAPWDSLYEVSTSKTRSKAGDPYIAVRVKKGRRTTDEEKQAAIEWAQTLHGAGQVAYDDTASDQDGQVTPQEPARTGGLAV